MSNQRCEACYHTPLPCMGGHAGRMAEAPPETGHAHRWEPRTLGERLSYEQGHKDAREQAEAEVATLRADVARLTAERDTLVHDNNANIIALVREKVAAVKEARAQVWAEAIRVVEQMAPGPARDIQYGSCCHSRHSPCSIQKELK